MRSVAKLALVALVAVMCVGASAATSASASELLFLTESKKALLFTVDGTGAVTLRAERAGAEGTIKCEKDSGHGFVLDKSSLAHEILLEFSGKCEQTSGSSKGTCTEPIKSVLAYGELGLLNGNGLLLVAPEKGTELVKISCTNGETKLAGAAISEFTLNGRGGSSQYGVSQKEFLLLSEPIIQEQEEIELLGSLMKGVSLKAEGFLGEKASEEAVQLLLFDGQAKIDAQPPPVAQPLWFSENRRLAQDAAPLRVNTGSGRGTVTFTTSGRLDRTCKMEDTGTIWNPVGRGGGRFSITTVVFPALTCRSESCNREPELVAPRQGLPWTWNAFLVAGSPATLRIPAMRIELWCERVLTGVYFGSAMVPVFNGGGVGEAACTENTHTTWLEFTATNNSFLLAGGVERAKLEGKDCIWGEARNEKITVETP